MVGTAFAMLIHAMVGGEMGKARSKGKWGIRLYRQVIGKVKGIALIRCYGSASPVPALIFKEKGFGKRRAEARVFSSGSEWQMP